MRVDEAKWLERQRFRWCKTRYEGYVYGENTDGTSRTLAKLNASKNVMNWLEYMDKQGKKTIEYSYIKKKRKEYQRDIYDHIDVLKNIIETIENIREKHPEDILEELNKNHII